MASCTARSGDITEKQPFKVFDLGCGEGVFLQAYCETIQEKFPKKFNNPDSLAGLLTGVEINPKNVAKARKRLTKKFGKPVSGWDIRTSTTTMTINGTAAGYIFQLQDQRGIRVM